MGLMDAWAKSMGFTSQSELLMMVSSVPDKTEADKKRYARWIEKDGTKQGLEKILKRANRAEAATR